MIFIQVLSAVSLATFTLGIPVFQLPCSSISGTPCRCPFGTNYAESVTTALIGATAGDVGALTNDFFNPSWDGLELREVQGPDNIPLLSVRDVEELTAVGTYSFRERLTFRWEFPNGSFEQRYELTGAIPYLSGNGSFAGYWVTIKGDRIFENETLFQYSSYSCETGHPRNFAAIRESALTNVSTMLQAKGLLRGISIKPESAQLF